jgi:hypothetical protein
MGEDVQHHALAALSSAQNAEPLISPKSCHKVRSGFHLWALVVDRFCADQAE